MSLFQIQAIKAILFDLDGTLRHNQPSSEGTFYKLAVELGVGVDHAAWLDGLRWAHKYWAQSEDMLSDYERYSGLTREFWLNYTRRHLIVNSVPESLIETLAVEIYTRFEAMEEPQEVVFPEVYETLSHLKDAGFVLGIVSNRTYSFLDKLEKLNLKGYMSCVLAAGEVGLWKPDPLIFHKALEILELQPGEVLFVGDNYYTDIVGSREAGIHPVLLDPEGVFDDPGCEVIKCITELKQLVDQKVSQP
jgi:HAD superfamily hydrolase (TIGR01549 family)